MARKPGKIKGATAGKVWRLKDTMPWSELAAQIEYPSSMVNQYLMARYKDEADTLWSRAICAGGVCEVSGLTAEYCQLNAHHLITRNNLRYRHDPMNGVCLSVSNHEFGRGVDICAHGDARQARNFLDWFRDNKPVQYKWWLEACEDKRARTETYQEAYERLVVL